MVVHIVMFKFKEETKTEHIAQAKAMLEALPEKIDELRRMEVGINFSDEARAMDMSIVTEFEDKEALAAYAVHPAHMEVVAFIKETTEYSKVVDYERA